MLRFSSPLPLGVCSLILVWASACSTGPRTYPKHTNPSAEHYDVWRERALSRESEPRDAHPPALWTRDLGLDALVRLAERRDPAVALAFERWRVAFEAVALAEKLPEPKLTLASYLTEVETRVGPMDGRIAVQQAWPWFGSLALAGDAAAARAEAARALFEDQRLASRLRVREVWFDLVDLGASIEVKRANLELVRHWEEVARVRFEANLADSTDLLRVQVEVGRLEQELASLEARYPTHWSRLALLVDLDVPTLGATRPGMETLPKSVDLVAESARRALDAGNPQTFAADARTQAADRDRELADKAFYPRLSLGLDYTFIGAAALPVSGSGDDAVAISLGLDVPIFRRAYRAGQRRGDALSRASRLERTLLVREQQATLEKLLFELDDQTRRETLFATDLVPKAEQSLRGLDRAYQAGDASYLELLDAERVLFTYQLELQRARVDHLRALARIERLTGERLLSPAALAEPTQPKNQIPKEEPAR